MKRLTGQGPLEAALLLVGLAALPACSHDSKGVKSASQERESGDVQDEEAKAQAAGEKAAGEKAAMAGDQRPAADSTPATKPSPEAASPESSVDPLAQLDRMGTFLRSLSEFSVEAATTKDEVLESGQKIQFERTVGMWVQRPNRMRAEVLSKGQQRSYFYDGKAFTLYSPKLGYYATFEAPPTLIELIDLADEKYDVQIPLADLFLFGTDQSREPEITTAIYVGPSEVLGVDTDHYAFRQPDVDWQIWIERGDKPLPRKLVITTKQAPEEPQYTSVYKWNLAPKLAANDFTFTPPTGANQIVFEVKKQP